MQKKQTFIDDKENFLETFEYIKNSFLTQLEFKPILMLMANSKENKIIHYKDFNEALEKALRSDYESIPIDYELTKAYFKDKDFAQYFMINVFFKTL